MEIQQGYGVWRRGQSAVIRRAIGEVYRTLEEVEMLTEDKSDLPKEVLDKIKEIRSRFPKCPQA
ncbi:MAG: hypothetical protein NT170_00800 [Candidatus Moranbacteria bacterium]|nr:hypothetical protein [Candidatus Moranbacteria bacterium]